MKVILKTDVKKVGKKGDIVEVSDGYGRNYLIARGLAVASTEKSREICKLCRNRCAETMLVVKRKQKKLRKN